MAIGRTIITGLLALHCAACASDATGTDAAGRVGRYVLSSINGKKLPGIVREDPNRRWQYHAGALRLNGDRTYTDSTDVTLTRIYLGEPIPDIPVQHYVDVAWGLYRVSGDTVYFDSLRDEHFYMVVHVSGSLLRNLDGVSLSYQR